MTQSKKHSFIEACTQVGSGMLISFTSYAVFDYLGVVEMTIQTNLWLTVYFTVLSLLRSYIVRRFYA